jgi:hypothetical protein
VRCLKELTETEPVDQPARQKMVKQNAQVHFAGRWVFSAGDILSIDARMVVRSLAISQA